MVLLFFNGLCRENREKARPKPAKTRAIAGRKQRRFATGNGRIPVRRAGDPGANPVSPRFGAAPRGFLEGEHNAGAPSCQAQTENIFSPRGDSAPKAPACPGNDGFLARPSIQARSFPRSGPVTSARGRPSRPPPPSSFPRKRESRAGKDGALASASSRHHGPFGPMEAGSGIRIWIPAFERVKKSRHVRVGVGSAESPSARSLPPRKRGNDEGGP